MLGRQLHAADNIKDSIPCDKILSEDAGIAKSHCTRRTPSHEHLQPRERLNLLAWPECGGKDVTKAQVILQSALQLRFIRFELIQPRRAERSEGRIIRQKCCDQC